MQQDRRRWTSRGRNDSKLKPCTYFQFGKCQKGAHCSYAHVEDPNFKRRPCEHFIRGTCRWGAACTFSHDFDQNEYEVTKTSQDKFVSFRNKIPQEPFRSQPLSESRLVELFQEALALVEGEAGIMQEVVSKLAAEGGLRRIEELLEKIDDALLDNELWIVLNSHLMPFFAVLTSMQVASSMILRSKLATIYNHLYAGDGSGERAVRIFRAVFNRLADEALEGTQDRFFTCLAVLTKLMDVNTPAHANMAYVDIVETCAAIMETLPQTGASYRALHDLQSLQRRLGLGESLQIVPGQRSIDKAEFHLSHDFPGVLSPDGVRHDNDNADIKEISIMPTMQEIECSRSEYLPVLDPQDWHLPGIAGLVDRSFRLLREDTIGQLRDAARAQLGKLRNQEISTTVRTYAYHGVYVANVGFEERPGMQFVLGFKRPAQNNQPSQKERQAWWDIHKRLRSDAVVCLLGEGVKFLTVAPDVMLNGEATRLQKEYDLSSETDAYVIVQAVNAKDETNLLEMISHGIHDMTLVEFPGVMLPAFVPTLKAMQAISGTLHLPFADVILGRSEVAPPAYAQGFRFDLSRICDGRGLGFMPGEDRVAAAQQLSELSKLDSGQATALIHSLSHALTCIQGPPGTGKSYTGAAIVQVQLANRHRSKIGPIVIVTFTNHALDQVLERLHVAGVDNIIRMGGRSKSEILEKCSLRNVAMNLDKTKSEKQDHYEARTGKRAEAEIIDECLDNLKNMRSGLKEVLQRYPRHYNQLFNLIDEDGFTRVSRSKGQIEAWLMGGDVNPRSRPRTVQELRDQARNLYSMSRIERRLLCDSWCEEYRVETMDKIAHARQAYDKHAEIMDGVRNELNLRVLRQAQVIGVTTSGLAKNLDLLKSVNAKLLICEEAGEVIEAHMLTALLPSIEHVVLIGDHQQLRPHIQNYALSVESQDGEKYALDMSLFERLVKKIPFCTLEVQRRMHPSISQLVRRTQYPDLKDGGLVATYKEVVGMRHRLFWMDHQQPEQHESTSHLNLFEVEMVANLVKHITQQGEYSTEDVAVITPYLGQLRAIRKRLASTHSLVLNERDEADLEKEGDDGEVVAPVKAGTLLQALRLATVDNFQGEEAKVVIISLVRSGDKPGFLRTPNRINVLLSRAQHGMYIIGNASTMSKVQMWSDVLEMIPRGPYLELCCPRHTNTPLVVNKPEDFLRLSPESGCDLLCDKQLKCGHACTAKCHSDMLHNAVHCTRPCIRLKPGCEHACRKVCGDKCDKKCRELVDAHIELDCGHVKDTLQCHLAQDPSKVVCNELVEKKAPCGHVNKVPCHQDKFTCTAACGERLDCGHGCDKMCDHDGECTCRRTCGRPFNACQHRCEKTCHEGDCGICMKRCETRCSHGQCAKKCSEACALCLETDCSSGRDCPHSKPCTMPCAAPCDWGPCSKRCEKLLECGCRCPSVCGETCPSKAFCQKCGILDPQVDMITMDTYKDINLDEQPCIFLPCGHFYTIDTLDGTVEFGKQPEPMDDIKLARCPECRGSLRSVARYGRIVRRVMLDEAMKKLVSWSADRHHELSQELVVLQETLQQTSPVTTSGAVTVDKLKTPRYRKLFQLMHRVDQYIADVTRHPLQTLYELVQSVGKKGQPPETQPREHLQANNLKLRCYVVLFGDAKRAGNVTLDLTKQMTKCLKLVDEAASTQNRMQQAEALILVCRFALLEDQLANIDGRLAEAEQICKELKAEHLLEEVAQLRRAAAGEEMKMIFATMAKGFRGTGHWYRCANGHPFTIGECGMPMELATCPECGAQIGGQDHQAVGGVESARDIEERFGRLHI